MKAKFCLLAMVGIFSITGCENSAKSEVFTRESEAVFTQQYEDDGVLCMEFETTDGNLWGVTDMAVPVGTTCTVVFDTCNTEEIEDDIVLEVHVHANLD